MSRLHGDGDQPLGLYILEHDNGSPASAISHVRITQHLRESRLARTFVRTLLMGIVQATVREGSTVLQVHALNLDPLVVEALQERGFVATARGWIKISVAEILTSDTILTQVHAALRTAGVDERPFDECIARLQSTNPAVSDVLQLEHLFWPAKIRGVGVPNFVVPIRPVWASDLFDAGLANDRLWAADADLALNPDSVYYRAVRPRVLEDRGQSLVCKL